MLSSHFKRTIFALNLAQNFRALSVLPICMSLKTFVNIAGQLLFVKKFFVDLPLR